MAHSKSAKKRHLQSLKRREQNRHVKATMRSQVKKARAEIAAGGASATAGELKAAIKAIAVLGRKKVLHPKTAARRISRLMKAANRSSS